MIPTISTIPLLQLASGDQLCLKVYKFRGKQPGKKVYIQSNLHGAEIAGNAVIHQLIEYFLTVDESEVVGEIWLVPVCNPVGTNHRAHNFSTGRYHIYDGKDWNRIFWDYEKECEDLEGFAQTQLSLPIEVIQENYLNRIQTAFNQLFTEIQLPSGVPYTDQYRYWLQSLTLDANYLIDLHSSTNHCVDFIYYFQGRQDSVPYFLLEYGMLLDKYDGDAFDEAFIKPWLALESQLAKFGKQVRFDKEAWTLELGSGMQAIPASVEKGFQGIQHYLVQKGILQAGTFSPDKSLAYKTTLKHRSQVKKYYAKAGGMIQNRVELGTTVQAGDRLYQILSFNKEYQLPRGIDVCSETAGLVFELSINECVNEGEFVLSMM